MENRTLRFIIIPNLAKNVPNVRPFHDDLDCQTIFLVIKVKRKTNTNLNKLNKNSRKERKKISRTCSL